MLYMNFSRYLSPKTIYSPNLCIVVPFYYIVIQLPNKKFNPVESKLTIR